MIKYGHTIIPHYRGTSFNPVHACTSVSESSNSVSSQNGITISSNRKTIFRPLIYLQMFVVDTYSSFSHIYGSTGTLPYVVDANWFATRAEHSWRTPSLQYVMHLLSRCTVCTSMIGLAFRFGERSLSMLHLHLHTSRTRSDDLHRLVILIRIQSPSDLSIICQDRWTRISSAHLSMELNQNVNANLNPKNQYDKTLG